MDKIGDRIRLRRQEIGLTQDEMAQRMGYKTRSSICKIENSDNMPLSKVTRIAHALNCDELYLMGLEHTSHSEQITDEEQNIIDKYRLSSEDTKEAVKAVLGIKRGIK